MPNDTTIKIYNGNPDNGQLRLSTDYCVVSINTQIHWVIDSTSNVDSIIGITRQGGDKIFDAGLTRETRGLTGKAVHSTRKGKEYKYYISWTEKDSTKSHIYDPKIAVLSTFNIWLLLTILVFILGLATLGIRKLFFTKK